MAFQLTDHVTRRRAFLLAAIAAIGSIAAYVGSETLRVGYGVARFGGGGYGQ